jgi:hypothetical protein
MAGFNGNLLSTAALSRLESRRLTRLEYSTIGLETKSQLPRTAAGHDRSSTTRCWCRWVETVFLCPFAPGTHFSTVCSTVGEKFAAKLRNSA